MGTEVLQPHGCLAAKPGGKHRAGRRAAAHGQAVAALPREVRIKGVADAYAGPACGAMSPSPRALPLPRFAERAVDDSATRELRRLLGLE